LTSTKVVLRHCTTKNNYVVHLLYKRVETVTLIVFYNQGVVSMSDKLGGIIQTFRERAGFTQDELGDRIGVSQQTIAKWEGGKSKPRPKALANLLHALNINGNKLREMEASSTIDTSKYLGNDRLAELMLTDPEITTWEAEDPALAGLKSTSLPTTFPAEARFNFGANPVALKRMIAPIVQAVDPTSTWDEMVKSPHGIWRVDYTNDELYAQILPAPTASALALHLRVNIYRYLWQYLTIGLPGSLAEGLGRYRLLIITYPQNQPINERIIDSPGTQSSATNEMLLRRITAEAADMGIYVVLARTPANVVAFLTNPARIYDAGWNYEYPGEEPIPYE
jgi:transcriptional regulator with XRE-family HTH domain